MRLSFLNIKNFRSFQDETIDLDSYNCFVGPNGAGKSTVLTALNILFRYDEGPSNVTALSKEDFHLENTDEPVEITAIFTDLSDNAKHDLQNYVRQDQLVISAIASWDVDQQSAPVIQKGQRLVMEDFSKYFEADSEGAYAKELKDIYRGLREEYSDLPDVYVKADMKNALREYEEDHPEKCELILSDDQFYGWSRGVNRLENYIQWVYIPAVKDVTEEQEEGRNTALGQLLERTIRQKVDFSDEIKGLEDELGKQYQDILDEHKTSLDGVGESIQSRLREWSHAGAQVDLSWHYDPDKSVSVNEPYARIQVGEGPFLGEILRAGHGMQRSFLVAMLHELAAGIVDEEKQPNLLLGIEEPELYQHPPQARHLRSVLETLADTDNQIFITTHSPYFVSANGVPSIRMTRRASGSSGTKVTNVSLGDVSTLLSDALDDDPQEPTSLMAKIHQIMQPSQRELFFSRVPVLVEGIEDVSLLSTYLHLSGRWNDFRRFGCHFVQCRGKGSMSRPLAICRAFEIPVFLVFDADTDDSDQINKHRKDNNCLLRLMDYELDPMPESNLWEKNLVVWQTKILDEVISEIGRDVWESNEQKARQKTKMVSGVNRKDAMLLSATLEQLWENDISSENLEKVCDLILEYAAVATSMTP